MSEVCLRCGDTPWLAYCCGGGDLATLRAEMVSEAERGEELASVAIRLIDALQQEQKGVQKLRRKIRKKVERIGRIARERDLLNILNGHLFAIATKPEDMEPWQKARAEQAEAVHRKLHPWLEHPWASDEQEERLGD